MNKKGQISVNTENIFPIIRKWLYSDHDIFLRELVSNASDAISKFERLQAFGEAKQLENEDYRIDIIYDREEKSLIVSDNGIGMTYEEVEKYINQIAFSGAIDFIEKYQDKTDGSGIIGHFGLGFYSVFMVAERVELDSLSWQEGQKPVLWKSEAGQEYEMSEGAREQRGTKIKLYFDQEAEKIFDAVKLREILNKYCKFMAHPIYFTDLHAEEEAKIQGQKRQQEAKEAYNKRRKEALDKGEAFDEKEPAAYQEPVKFPINNTEPLWLKAPKDCSDEQYKSFYREAFADYKEPLFWIHLNMDYPFNLKGILYFPQYENKYETLDGRIKLYNNQVFVADNIKEVIPEFLFLLKGALDCPDLPLNVSRSFLQADAYVKKLAEHITRKVADKLNKLFKDERENYEKYWKDIKVFVKYGCLRDEKFFERVKDSLLFTATDGKNYTVSDLDEKIYYVNEPGKQAVYINNAVSSGHKVIIMDHEIDSHFIQFLEHKLSSCKFLRVDSLSEAELAEEGEEAEGLRELFAKLSNIDKQKIELRKLGEDRPAALIQESEDSRRMQEFQKSFMRMQGLAEGADMSELFPLERSLILNVDHQIIKLLKSKKDEEIARHIYLLARLAHGSLEANDLADFVSSSASLLYKLAEEKDA